MKQRLWRLFLLLDGFWMGDRGWGTFRLLVLFAGAFMYMVVGRFIFENVDAWAIAQSWYQGVVILRLFRVPLPFLELLANFLNPAALRYWIIPSIALVGMLMLGARYIQDVYELKRFRLGLRYLTASLFAIEYPHLVISDGKADVKAGTINLVDAIGGPGYVSIQPGNVVLFERLREPASVRAAGLYFVPRLEKIRQIASLNDQHGYIEKVTAVTKDGIEVTVRDINYRYRLRTGRRWGDYAQRRTDQPYPFSIQAVKNMAYRRSVRADGLTAWPMAINTIIDSAITGFIASHQLDYLTAPKRQVKDPRPEIQTHVFSKGIRESLKNLGAELLWCDIGHFDVPDPADSQRIETWGARWKGNANVVEAYGEAKRIAYQELGRGQAQAEILMSIVQAFEEANLQDHKDNVSKIILARTAEVLELISKQGNVPLIEDKPPHPHH